jgi:hypothetical protein
MGGHRTAQGKQREHPDLSGNTAELQQRSVVKRRIELAAVEEKEMGAKRQIEMAIREGKRWQSSGQATPLSHSRWKVAQEGLHGNHAHPAKCLHRWDGLPDELLLILSGLMDHFVKGGGNPCFDVLLAEGIDGIAGHHRHAASGGFRIGTGWPIATAKHPSRQVAFGHEKHGPVLLEGSAPGNNVIQGGHGGGNNVLGSISQQVTTRSAQSWHEHHTPAAEGVNHFVSAIESERNLRDLELARRGHARHPRLRCSFLKSASNGQMLAAEA